MNYELSAKLCLLLTGYLYLFLPAFPFPPECYDEGEEDEFEVEEEGLVFDIVGSVPHCFMNVKY